MITYIAAAGDDNIISTGPAFLERIIVGADVGSGVIEVSDSKTIGDEDIKVSLSGSTMIGVYEVRAEFRKGITADLANQTNVSFVWHPMAA